MQNSDRIDCLGDVFASGVLAAVPNTTDRITLIFDAAKSGSDPTRPNFRKNWYSDSSVARQAGRSRQKVNDSQGRLQAIGITRRHHMQGTRSRLTEIVDFERLCIIGERADGSTRVLQPAPTRVGAGSIHLVDEVFKSSILQFFYDTAAELLILVAWLVQSDPDADDFGAYDIGKSELAAILHRDPKTVRNAESTLARANLTARDGNTIRLLAHNAKDIAQRKPGLDPRRRQFTQEARERCTRRRAEPPAPTDEKRGAVTTHRADPQQGAVMTHHGARSRHIMGRGHDTPWGAVTTQTTIELQKRTISKNHKGASENGEGNFWNDNDQTQNENNAEVIALDPEDIWQETLHELALQLPQTTFETWVRDTAIINYTEGEFTVGAPHAWTRDWLQNRLSKKVKDILDKLTGRSVQVFFEVRDQQQNRSDTIDILQEEPAPDPDPEPAAEAAARPTETVPEVLDDAQDRKTTQKVRLIELVETRAQNPHQYNQIIRAINAEIASVKSEQLTEAEKDDRIGELIARCIAILEDQPAPDPEPTAGKPDEVNESAPRQAHLDPLRQVKDAEIAYSKARIEHNNQRQRQLPQPRKGRFIPADQIPVITTDQIPFAAIAAVWDEPWMVEAITEFERRMQPWLDLDTGDDPFRVEATYNPNRPHDMPHIINMKHAYALQQRISAEQWAGAGLSDPLTPLIKAHQARPYNGPKTALIPAALIPGRALN